MTGGSTERRSGASQSSDKSLHLIKSIYCWCLTGVLAFYLMSGLTVVGPGEVAIVLRWGQLRTDNSEPLVFQPGLMFALPKPLDRVIRVPVREERTIEVKLADSNYEIRQEAREQTLEHEGSKEPSVSSIANEPIVSDWALTGDRQALTVHLRAKYRISNPVAFALTNVDAEAVGIRVLRSATTSILSNWSVDEAMRLRSQRLAGAISPQKLDELQFPRVVADAIKKANLPLDPTPSEFRRSMRGQNLTASEISEATDILKRMAPTPATLAEKIQERTQSRLDKLKVGLSISSLEIQEVSPPTSAMVKAFEAVQSARIAQETLTDIARGDGKSEVINKQLLANEYIADANGKRSTKLAEANEKADEFLAALSVLRNSDSLTEKKRLYYATWQEIMENSALYLVSPGDQETRLKVTPSGDFR